MRKTPAKATKRAPEYVHAACATVTKTSDYIASFAAHESLFCANCQAKFPAEEFTWRVAEDEGSDQAGEEEAHGASS